MLQKHLLSVDPAAHSFGNVLSGNLDLLNTKELYNTYINLGEYQKMCILLNYNFQLQYDKNQHYVITIKYYLRPTIFFAFPWMDIAVLVQAFLEI